jgi:mono/diheme cytochrome c family protein
MIRAHQAGGPTLQALRNSAVVLQVVSEGRNAMPGFNGSLTADQIRDVATYVSERLAQSGGALSAERATQASRRAHQIAQSSRFTEKHRFLPLHR